jgi:hypothetical protein
VHFHDVALLNVEVEDEIDEGFGFGVPQTVQAVALFGFLTVQAPQVHSVLFVDDVFSGLGLPQTVQADTDFGFSTVHLSHFHMLLLDDDFTVPVNTGSCATLPLLLLLLKLG